MIKENHGKQKINRNMTFLMNNFLSTNSKNFENQLNYFLSLRKKNSDVKLIVVRKILREIKKKKR